MKLIVSPFYLLEEYRILKYSLVSALSSPTVGRHGILYNYFAWLGNEWDGYVTLVGVMKETLKNDQVSRRKLSEPIAALILVAGSINMRSTAETAPQQGRRRTEKIRRKKELENC